MSVKEEKKFLTLEKLMECKKYDEGRREKLLLFQEHFFTEGVQR